MAYPARAGVMIVRTLAPTSTKTASASVPRYWKDW